MIYPEYCFCVEKADMHVPFAGVLYEMVMSELRGDFRVLPYVTGGGWCDTPWVCRANAATIASKVGGRFVS